MVSILLGWWWGGSLLVLLLLLKRVCAYHSLSLSFQLFCISRYVARLVLCCVQSLLSVDWPFPLLLLLLYYYSLPNALAYYSRRHDAPIIHSCCKLPHKTFFIFVFFRIFFFFSLTFALKRSSQCRPASSSFALACVMYISLFFIFIFLSPESDWERAMMAWRIRFVWAATPSGCLRVISPPTPPPLSYTVHV